MAKNSRRCRKRRRNGLPWANVTLELDNPHQRTTPHIQTNTVTGQAETDSPGEKPGLYDRIKIDRNLPDFPPSLLARLSPRVRELTQEAAWNVQKAML